MCGGYRPPLGVTDATLPGESGWPRLSGVTGVAVSGAGVAGRVGVLVKGSLGPLTTRIPVLNGVAGLGWGAATGNSRVGATTFVLTADDVTKRNVPSGFLTLTAPARLTPVATGVRTRGLDWDSGEPLPPFTEYDAEGSPPPTGIRDPSAAMNRGCGGVKLAGFMSLPVSWNSFSL